MNRKQQIDILKLGLDRFYDTKNITITAINVDNDIVSIVETTGNSRVENKTLTIEIEYAELEEKRK